MKLMWRLTGVVLAVSLSNSAIGDVQIRHTKNSTEYISIEGNIAPGDSQKLLALLPKWGGAIALNSSGGDVFSALELGRTMRTKGLEAFVANNATCASACVFVLAGAPRRVIWGNVVIHRPFLPNDTSTNPGEQKSLYSKLGVSVRDYLGEMNTSPSLYEDMLRVPSTRGKILTPAELERYGLSGTDPYIDEARNTERANELRISKAEYIRRQQQIESQCLPIMQRSASEYGKCAVAVEYGISRKEYDRRESQAAKVCANESDRAAEVRCSDRILRGLWNP